MFLPAAHSNTLGTIYNSRKYIKSVMVIDILLVDQPGTARRYPRRQRAHDKCIADRAVRAVP